MNRSEKTAAVRPIERQSRQVDTVDRKNTENRVPSLKALEQVGGPELDGFIDLPRRERWSTEVNFEDWDS